MVWGPPK
jgi:hypothetical protein